MADPPHGANRVADASDTLPRLRVCIVYDCLFPYTIGGAERWYRDLATELVAAGHDVTYLTRRQWPAEDPPRIPGVRVVGVSPGGPLYTPSGRRTISSPMRFGLGVLRHLLRHRGGYDVVHSCAFPYFSLIAARVALLRRPTVLALDWFEVWTRQYWRQYLGLAGGAVGSLVQRSCVRLTRHAFVFSELHARRLREDGIRDEPVRLQGLYGGSLELRGDPTDATAPLVVFAGRHIPEKRVPLIPAAIAAARRRIPDLRALVLGDGPERRLLLDEIEANGVGDVVEAPGFVDSLEVDDAMRRATCLLLPSSREGYGLVVIEAAAWATPSVVVAGPDNAAVELVQPGVNGVIAPRDDAESIADAIVAVHEGGTPLRASTAAWFAAAAPRLTVAASTRVVRECYAAWASARS